MSSTVLVVDDDRANLESVCRIFQREGVSTLSASNGQEALELEVHDDGRGLDPSGQPGHGLVGIRERVAVVGGEVTAGPGADGGFAVSVRLPYAMEA